MVEISKELWEQIVKDLKTAWWHYFPGGSVSLWIRLESKAVRIGYTQDNRYFVMDGLYDAYMMDDDDLPF